MGFTLLNHPIGYLAGTLVLHSRLPKREGPNTSCPRQGNLVKKIGRNDPLVYKNVHAQRAGILHMYMNMVLAHDTFQDMNVLRIADLNQ